MLPTNHTPSAIVNDALSTRMSPHHRIGCRIIRCSNTAVTATIPFPIHALRSSTTSSTRNLTTNERSRVHTQQSTDVQLHVTRHCRYPSIARLHSCCSLSSNRLASSVVPFASHVPIASRSVLHSSMRSHAMQPSQSSSAVNILTPADPRCIHRSRVYTRGMIEQRMFAFAATPLRS